LGVAALRPGGAIRRFCRGRPRSGVARLLSGVATPVRDVGRRRRGIGGPARNIAITRRREDRHGDLRRHALFDVDEGLHALAVRDQFRPLTLRIGAIAAALQFTIDSKLAHAAVETLQTYEWSKRHAHTAEGTALRPYVAEMRRVMTKTINRRQQKAPAPPENESPNNQ